MQKPNKTRTWQKLLKTPLQCAYGSWGSERSIVCSVYDVLLKEMGCALCFLSTPPTGWSVDVVDEIWTCHPRIWDGSHGLRTAEPQSRKSVASQYRGNILPVLDFQCSDYFVCEKEMNFLLGYVMPLLCLDFCFNSSWVYVLTNKFDAIDYVW